MSHHYQIDTYRVQVQVQVVVFPLIFCEYKGFMFPESDSLKKHFS